MLTSNQLDFQKAVFEVEDAYHDGAIEWSDFKSEMRDVSLGLNQMIIDHGFQNHKTAGNWAIFTWITSDCKENNYQSCKYNFEDFLGEKEYSNCFVTTLLKSKKGNCLSLPLLYKCLAQEMNVEAHLTLGPSHCWIRHKDEEGRWANIELTSGQFPTDGLLMTELGIRTEAIKTGAYFKALNEEESVAFLLTQLAKGYIAKYNKQDQFVKDCLDLSLEYFPNNPFAYMMLSNWAAERAQNEMDNGGRRSGEMRGMHAQYRQAQTKLIELGADSIEPDSYTDWVNSMKTRTE